MSNLELFVSPSNIFSGFQYNLVDADYVIIGVPLDFTSSYRSGSSFGPNAIRNASLNIESYSFRAGVHFEEIKIHDMGDLHISGNIDETIKRLELVSFEILKKRKIAIFIGGEHTLTLGAVKGICGDYALLCFDAHLDLRDKYLNQKICHATVTRRINEISKPSKIIMLGTHAVCKEELEYAKSQEIEYITLQEVLNQGSKEIIKKINYLLTDYEQIYLTIDVDVLDPAYAPAVQNPEPEGLSTHMLFEILSKVCNSRIIGFDIVEVTPNYDNGVTSILASKIIYEICSYIHLDRIKSTN
jgi:agmatinase